MRRIQKIGNQAGVPDISEISPVLSLPVMEFDSINSAMQDHAQREKDDIDRAEENFANLLEMRDENTGEDLHNNDQKARFNAAKEKVGAGKNLYNVSTDQLKDAHTMRRIESTLNKVYRNPDVKEILFEKGHAEKYFAAIAPLKSSNPALYRMGLAEFNKYRNDGTVDDGEGKQRPMKGTDLNPGNYTNVDIKARLIKALKDAPQISVSDIGENDKFNYVETVKQRSKELMYILAEELEKDPAFMNNVIAKYGEGMEGYVAMLDGLVEEYAEKNIDIKSLKAKPVTGPSGKLTEEGRKRAAYKKLLDSSNIVPGSGKMVGKDVDLNTVEKGSVTDIEELDAAKGFVKKEIVDDKLVVTYKTGGDFYTIQYDIAEDVDPITGQVVGPSSYKMETDEGDINVTQGQVDNYKKVHKKVRKENDATVWASNNKGQDVVAEIDESGKVTTNDVQFLIDVGLVPEGTDYNDLDDLGYEFKHNEDGTTLAIKEGVDPVIDPVIDRGGYKVPKVSGVVKTTKSSGKGPVPKGYTSDGSNNPLNIRPVGDTKNFNIYDTMEDGVSAGMRLISRYIVGNNSSLKKNKKKHWGTPNKPVTIEEIIGTWSPSKKIGGDTEDTVVKKYIKDVSNMLGVEPDTIASEVDIKQLAKAMISTECPKCLKKIEKEYGSFEEMLDTNKETTIGEDSRKKLLK